MKFGQQDRPKERAPRKARGRTVRSLVAHRAFAPILGLWGTMLAGLTVMVLPSALIEQALSGTMIGASGLPLQPIAAAIAALLLGGGLFAIAAGASLRARRRAGEPSILKRAIHPIDPLRDLGSSSLDDPIETTRFATPAWLDAEMLDVAPETQSVPRELNLAEFAELPGRNAVWVEDVAEPVAQHAPEPAPEPLPVAEPVADEPVTDTAVTALHQAATVPDPGTAALARLRAQPTSELSMAEMVERFAGALHEHRTSPPTRALTAADLAAREAALAEALKALAALSGESTSDAAKEPLRAALAQLQTPRKVGGGLG
ncbi:hypothetical protein GCM10009076_20510 [Erythrobacter ramosus]